MSSDFADETCATCETSALLARQANVPLHHLPLRCRRLTAQSQLERRDSLVHGIAARDLGVFGMLNHRKPDFGGQRQRLAHDVVIQNRLAIITQRHRTGFLQPAIIAELFAQATQGCRGDRKDVYHRAAFLVLNPSRHRRRIVDRARIRHRANRGESAGRRRSGSGCNAFLVSLSGFTKVYMKIDEAGSDHQPFQVQRLIGAAFGFAWFGNLFNAAIAEHDIGQGIKSSRRVDQVPAL